MAIMGASKEVGAENADRINSLKNRIPLRITDLGKEDYKAGSARMSLSHSINKAIHLTRIFL